MVVCYVASRSPVGRRQTDIPVCPSHFDVAFIHGRHHTPHWKSVRRGDPSGRPAMCGRDCQVKRTFNAIYGRHGMTNYLESMTRVLHVDDDPAMTRLSAHLLREHHIEVTGLHDSTKALGRIVEENFRIAIVDLQMPLLDGFELLRRIKEADGGVSVIVLTGVVSQATIMDSMRQGAAACFFKPLTDVSNLVDCITDINKSRRRWQNTLRQLTQLRKLPGFAATPTTSTVNA